MVKTFIFDIIMSAQKIGEIDFSLKIVIFYHFDVNYILSLWWLLDTMVYSGMKTFVWNIFSYEHTNIRVCALVRTMMSWYIVLLNKIFLQFFDKSTRLDNGITGKLWSVMYGNEDIIKLSFLDKLPNRGLMESRGLKHTK